jgi:phosphoadenosine phosphosulfate reductase
LAQVSLQRQVPSAEAPADPAPAPELPDLEGAPAEEIVAWAVKEFFPDITVACSMQDAVVVDLAWRVEPRIEVFFLETRFHFSETLATARRMRSRYNLNLVEVKPVDSPAVWHKDGYEACCHDRKVAPMERYLAGKLAWMSGIRRAESPTRSNARAVSWDAKRRLVKVNPIVAWSDEQVESYIAERGLIVNPLLFEGYASIGCHPCTLPAAGREGRWAGVGKLECGIHQEPALEQPPLMQDGVQAGPK